MKQLVVSGLVVAALVAAGTLVRAAPSGEAHGGLTGDLDCNACHTTDSWTLSAGAGVSGFDHDKTGFKLRAMHARTTCTSCHNGKRPSETCDGCHRDPHQGRMDGQCYECHTAVAWSDTNTLEAHRRTRMPLTGQHAIVDCVECHKRQEERTWTDLPVDCYACHQTEYHAASTHPNHDGSAGGKPYPRDCGQCHNPISWSLAFTNPNTVLSRAAQIRDHEPFFSLSSGSHTALDCASCHVDPVRRVRAVRCDACHDEVSLRTQHRARMISDAMSCLRCHPRGARR